MHVLTAKIAERPSNPIGLAPKICVARSVRSETPSIDETSGLVKSAALFGKLASMAACSAMRHLFADDRADQESGNGQKKEIPCRPQCHVMHDRSLLSRSHVYRNGHTKDESTRNTINFAKILCGWHRLLLGIESNDCFRRGLQHTSVTKTTRTVIVIYSGQAMDTLFTFKTCVMGTVDSRGGRSVACPA